MHAVACRLVPAQWSSYAQCSVHFEIKMILYRYRIARSDDGRLFVYGYDRATASVCIVQLREFNAATLTGSAKDGTQLTLEGAPALDLNAGWFWAEFRAREGIASYADVTP